MVDMCTCYRKRNPNFDVVESEVLFGCENVRNISQRVWWWWWWWGGGGFLCVGYCHLPFSSPHTCGRFRALPSIPGK